MAKRIGEVLRQARLDAGLSTRDLERLTGMATAAISQVENGVRRDPGFSTVLRLAQAIGITLDEVVNRLEGGEHGAPGRRIGSALSKMQKAHESVARTKAQIEDAISALNSAGKPAGGRKR